MSDDDPRHGTTAGYYAHRAGKTRVCDPCRTARQSERADYRPCRHCAKPTSSVKRVCRECLGFQRQQEEQRGYSDDDELTGGRWVPRDGIMRWEAAA